MDFPSRCKTEPKLFAVLGVAYSVSILDVLLHKHSTPPPGFSCGVNLRERLFLGVIGLIAPPSIPFVVGELYRVSTKPLYTRRVISLACGISNPRALYFSTVSGSSVVIAFRASILAHNGSEVATFSTVSIVFRPNPLPWSARET